MLPVLIILIAALSPSSIVSAQKFLELKVVEIGKEVPDFTLKDLSGAPRSLSAYRGKIVMLYFWSATCPYVLRYEERLNEMVADYTNQNVVVLGIDSNENENLEQIKKVSEKRQVSYPILIDPGNRVADEFGAITTPHVFIIDTDGKLAYEGAVDNQSWSEENPVTEQYARAALDSLVKGETVKLPATDTFGCTVKRAFKK